jgi:GNAT superfamily N-acetyltransferase
MLLTTLVYMLAGAAVFVNWRMTGKLAALNFFFTVPSAILLVGLAAAQLWFCLAVCAEFSPGEPMLAAWRLIGLASFFDLAGSLGVQLLGSRISVFPKQVTFLISQTGYILQGPCRFILLAAGLFAVLRIYREAGFLGRLRLTDWALAGVFAAYCVREALDLIAQFHKGKPFSWLEAARWPVDPTLCLLLAEALLLHRSVQRTGVGLIGRCWRMYSAGILLVLLGDAIVWAEAYGYLVWPWNSIGWYVWIPAAAAFALAPAYQLEAIKWANSGQGGPAE